MQRMCCHVKFGQEALIRQILIPIRTKMKWKKQKARGNFVSVTDRVLEYFDLYYTPTYKKLWPSIRISLLSAKKPAAVINNFAANNKHPQKLFDKGAYNMIGLASERQKETIQICDVTGKQLQNTANDMVEGQTILDSYELQTDIVTEDTDQMNRLTELENFRKDLDVFVTNKTLYYDDPELDPNEESEVEGDEDGLDSSEGIDNDTRVEFTALNNKVDIVKPKPLSIPVHLNVLTFLPGDISDFPAVRGDSDGRLFYYMMDGSSVLPVIALGLERGDSVLDLCAAPGGKSITMLQTGLPGRLHCNDLCKSRVRKLHRFMNFCVPQSKQTHVEITTMDGREFVIPEYNKVLVDVPCNTDRHFLTTLENNLFSRDRADDRLELPHTQRDLLVSGIKSCLPGGNIVYSTCTLAPGQNDGTVQLALDEVLQTTDIEVVVEDLQEMVELFKDTFKFYHECRFGKLVIPSLLSNFGPMYICRLKRIR